MSPSKGHESVSRVVALLVEELAVELDLDVESAGSTTFKREDITRGFKPDQHRGFRLQAHLSFPRKQESTSSARRRPVRGGIVIHPDLVSALCLAEMLIG